VAIVLAFSVVHAVVALLLSKTGSGAFSLNNPISDVMVGLLIVFAMFKLTHVFEFMHRDGHGSSRRSRTATSNVHKGE